ncbi:MAG TPA: xanthine dehydrogenase family protein subunit M [Actinomycetota bacterium]|nr:xanthine dehydrogenase family protein subunit M [Actinomycetota bacterium]
MIPAAFDYERAESVEHAVQLLGQHGDEAKIIAGGHSLLPLMRLRFARPSVLVDIDRLSDLEYVRDAGDHVEIGALTRMADVAANADLHAAAPLLAYAAGQVGDPQVRHRGTIGGSVAHGDPASDPPAVLLALGAELVATGPSGERTVPASEFFKGIFETALAPDEVLTTIRVPKTNAGWSYQKFHRRAIDWAIVGVAALVERSNGGIGASVTLTNMGPSAIRASGVEEALAGSDGSAASLATAAEHAPENTSPPSDTNASAEYRRALAKVLVRRALEEALAR